MSEDFLKLKSENIIELIRLPLLRGCAQINLSKL